MVFHASCFEWIKYVPAKRCLCNWTWLYRLHTNPQYLPSIELTITQDFHPSILPEVHTCPAGFLSTTLLQWKQPQLVIIKYILILHCKYLHVEHGIYFILPQMMQLHLNFPSHFLTGLAPNLLDWLEILVIEQLPNDWLEVFFEYLTCLIKHSDFDLDLNGQLDKYQNAAEQR